MIALQETPQERTFRHILLAVVNGETTPKVPVLDGRTFAPLQGDWTYVSERPEPTPPEGAPAAPK